MQRSYLRTLHTLWRLRRRSCSDTCSSAYSVSWRCIASSAEDEQRVAAVETLRSVAQRLPRAGLTAAHLQALLEDEYPLFSPSAVDALTLRDAVQKFPELFLVEPGTRGSWTVRPATVKYNNSSNTQDVREAYKKVVEYCKAQTERKAQGSSAGDFVPLERIMRELQLSDVDVVDEVCARAGQELDVQVTLQMRPRRAARCAILFIDGSALTTETIRVICTELNILQEGSTMYIARHSSRALMTSSTNATDSVLPAMPSASIVSVPVSVPLSVALERQAHELRLSTPDVLQDIVYMCAEAQWDHYRDVVAPRNAFPDADVYVCSPHRMELVTAKRVIPFTLTAEATAS